MELNKDVTEEDLNSIFQHFEILNKDLSKLASDIFKIETDKKLLSKPSMFVFSIINRAVALNNGYKSLALIDNYVAAINLLRIQADNCMRLFAMTLVDNRAEFFNKISNGVHIRNIKDTKGRKMTDLLLSTELEKIFPGFRSLYENSSGLIHFSNEHLNQNTNTQVSENNLSGIILINGEHFLSMARKVDYSYNMYLVTTELFKLIKGYKLHVEEFMQKH